ncbi:hypothetical protein [Priestia megaterium]|uniref:hypothetical protein n=1 Tax=Priestia megaterium TaxID=1404 RepID=UPI0015CF2AB1
MDQQYKKVYYTTKMCVLVRMIYIIYDKSANGFYDKLYVNWLLIVSYTGYRLQLTVHH